MDSKIILLEDILSPTECQLLIKLCEAHGFSTQNRNKHGVTFEDPSFRNDLQCTLHDPSDILFESPKVAHSGRLIVRD